MMLKGQDSLSVPQGAQLRASLRLLLFCGFAFLISSFFLAKSANANSLGGSSAKSCKALFSKTLRFQKTRPEVRELQFDMPGMRIASLSDPTLATGATLFLFDGKATANYDARGGSVASIETSLLDESSYSNEINGILFAGGSTMGLEATQGVRRRIFEQRASDAGEFDLIPSIPGAVVYDYGARVDQTQNKLVYPGLTMGAALHDQAKANSILIGRVGAGTSTTANKISEPIWGGQGAAFKEVNLGDGVIIKIFTAVIVNAHGNITLPQGVRLNPESLALLQGVQVPSGHRKNTTLSITVTDAALDRSQLKRLAQMVHTSMARAIHPFHSYTDGDISFAVSLQRTALGRDSYQKEEILQTMASELMQESIIRSVAVANNGGTPPPSKEEK